MLSNKYPKARKNHICDFCGTIILKGKKYQNTLIADGRSIYNHKAHLSCMTMSEKLDMFEQCDENGLSGDDFQEFIKEEYFEVTKDDSDVEFRLKLDYLKEYYGII